MFDVHKQLFKVIDKRLRGIFLFLTNFIFMNGFNILHLHINLKIKHMKKFECDFNSVCTMVILVFILALGTIALINCDKTNNSPKTGLTWININGVETSIK